MRDINFRIETMINYFSNGNKSDFAKKIGEDESRIRKYLTGTEPKFSILEKIAIVFGINSEWLLTGKGEMLKSNNSVSNIRAGGDVIASNNSTVTVNKGLSMEEQVQQENLKLQYEMKMKDREIEMRDREIEMLKREVNILERDIASYRESLEQQKISQELIKELYERKVEDLKRTINILETRMEIDNKN